jgi:Flp pilus assembly protein TadB
VLGIVRDWVSESKAREFSRASATTRGCRAAASLLLLWPIMMVLTFLLIAVASFALLKKTQWGWILVMVALLMALGIFINDVDFSTNLGLQFS